MTFEMKIINSATPFVTPWFEIVAKQTDLNPAPYYSLKMPDYVTIVALTLDGELLLVRQYRPAVERETLELPSGHVELSEPPEASARRELLEETGYQASRMEWLGTLAPDTGRLGNRLWCFFASGVFPSVARRPKEDGLELVRYRQNEVFSLIAQSQLDHALHVAALMLAMVKHGPGLFAVGR